MPLFEQVSKRTLRVWNLRRHSSRKSPHLGAASWLVAALAFSGCHGAPSAPIAGATASFHLNSPSFQDGRIPASFTCDGANTSPALTWTEPPAATRSFALVVTDPDAPGGVFVHWVLFNLPAARRSLAAIAPGQEQLPDGSRQGRNDFGAIGYGGPCPPPHSSHRYVFSLFALDLLLNLPAGASRQQVDDAAQGHVLAHAELTERYGH